MDGFGRELLDQYYKVGSSLEVMCQVDRLPARPLPDIIEWRHGSSKLPKSNSTSGQRYVITDALLVSNAMPPRSTWPQIREQMSGPDIS